MESKEQETTPSVDHKGYWADPRWAKVSQMRKNNPMEVTALVDEIRVTHGLKPYGEI